VRDGVKFRHLRGLERIAREIGAPLRLLGATRAMPFQLSVFNGRVHRIMFSALGHRTKHWSRRTEILKPPPVGMVNNNKKNKLCGLSPRANYTDRETAASRQS
jgi:hypothetical protein